MSADPPRDRTREARPGFAIDPIEWDFAVPASEVDLERIVRELSLFSAAQLAAYLRALKIKAPSVYARLAVYAKERSALTCWRWEDS